MKVLSGMTLRQTTGFVKGLMKLVDLEWTVPDFGTPSRRQIDLIGRTRLPVRILGRASPVARRDESGLKAANVFCGDGHQDSGDSRELPAAALPAIELLVFIIR